MVRQIRPGGVRSPGSRRRAVRQGGRLWRFREYLTYRKITRKPRPTQDSATATTPNRPRLPSHRAHRRASWTEQPLPARRRQPRARRRATARQATMRTRRWTRAWPASTSAPLWTKRRQPRSASRGRARPPRRPGEPGQPEPGLGRQRLHPGGGHRAESTGQDQEVRRPATHTRPRNRPHSPLCFAGSEAASRQSISKRHSDLWSFDSSGASGEI